MRVFMKSALRDPDLAYRNRIRQNRIEIQLLDEIDNDLLVIDDSLKMISKNGIEIEAIHTPIVDRDSVELQNLTDGFSLHRFIKTCELAQAVGAMQGKQIKVILHNGEQLDILQSRPAYLSAIDESILICLKQYPNVDICIENETPVIFLKHAVGRTGFLSDAAEYVRYFRTKYGYQHRVTSLLDTCHALVSCRLMGYCGHVVTIEDFFNWNKDTIGLIHLANAKNSGYGEDEHGTVFSTPADLELLRTIFAAYRKYRYNVPITIEVTETNYLDCKNFIETFENLAEFR